MNQYLSFFKKTLIFLLSTVGSKAATILLIPMYSYVLLLEEYGEVEIYLTILMLLMPIITGSLYEAVQKFCINDPGMKGEIISTALYAFFAVVIMASFAVIIVYLMYWKSEKLILIFLILISVSTYQFLSKFANGVGREFSFAISNILVATALLGANVFLVYFQEKGVVGILQSQFIAYTVGVLYLFLSLRLDKIISFNKISLNLLKRMLMLSAPLIVNAAMWWVFSASDRWIILHFEGPGEVGLYSVSSKLAVILLMLHTVFLQAWQISAIESENDNNKAVFYSNIFEFYILLIILCTSLLISINEVVLSASLSKEYAEAWRVGNLLLLSTSFYCLASFLGVFYVVYSRTSRALYSSVAAAILNLILNLLLIPKYGGAGAALATIISTLFLFGFRLWDTQKVVTYPYRKFLVLILFSVIIIQAFSASKGEYLFSYFITFSLMLFLFFRFKTNFFALVRMYVK